MSTDTATACQELCATNVGPDRIELAYQRFGDPAAPPVLMITGGQLISWPDGLCQELADRGLAPIRFDNRDSGRSTRCPGARVPDLAAALAGDLSSASYTLAEMAADSVGLLDVLGIDSAHLVGSSLGAMIAQTIAIEHPARARSLTSMSSRPGDPDSGGLDLARLAPIGSPPPDRAGHIAWEVRAFRAIGSPGYPFDETAVAQRAARAYDRGYDRTADLRQKVAVVASGDRTTQLRHLRLPTLVIHGTDDPMCDVSGGRATAAAIPGADLEIYQGMGHSLPRQLWPRIAARIATLIRHTETAPTGEG